MPASNQLYSFSDVINALNALAATSKSALPLLKPGVTSHPASSTKVMTWSETLSNLLVADSSGTSNRLYTWSRVTGFSYVEYTGTIQPWDSWGGNWYEFGIYMYSGSQPTTDTTHYKLVSVGLSTGQALAVTYYYVNGNWWSGSNTHFVYGSKTAGNGAQYYSSFVDNRQYQTTNGNITLYSAGTSPKGQILAIIPYNGYLKETSWADNVGAGDATMTFTLGGFVIPWPY